MSGFLYVTVTVFDALTRAVYSAGTEYIVLAHPTETASPSDAPVTVIVSDEVAPGIVLGKSRVEDPLRPFIKVNDDEEFVNLISVPLFSTSPFIGVVLYDPDAKFKAALVVDCPVRFAHNIVPPTSVVLFPDLKRQLFPSFDNAGFVEIADPATIREGLPKLALKKDKTPFDGDCNIVPLVHPIVFDVPAIKSFVTVRLVPVADPISGVINEGVFENTTDH